MPQVVGRRKPQAEQNSTRMKPSEIVVMVAVVLLALAGIRYYLMYRKSPQYVVGAYLGAIKAGSVSSQYALVSEVDKQYPAFATVDDYEKNAPQSRGYTERFADIIVKQPVPVPNKPDDVNVEATVAVRAMTKNITDTGDTKSFTDKYRVHKDSDGQWRVVLSKSGDGYGNISLLKAEKNAPGSNF